MSQLRIGQMVVCVNDTIVGAGEPYAHNVAKGCIYTVREIYVAQSTGGIAPLVHLEEVVNPPRLLGKRGMAEPGFLARRFRPVKDTSIEIFRKLVVPMPFSAWQTGERVKNYE